MSVPEFSPLYDHGERPVPVLPWDEFVDPAGFFTLMKTLVAFDAETTRFAIHTDTVDTYQEVHRSILN